MLDFAGLPLPANIAIFAIAAVSVWLAGSRLTRYADAIANATGIGQAVAGIVLLAGVTSLPEIAVTATASIAGNAELAVNNLFGSIAMQVAILAVLDFAIGRKALTAVVPDPGILLQGSLNVILITGAAAAMVIGDVALFGIGAWSWAALFAYIASVRMLSRMQGRRPWLAASNGRVQHQLIDSQSKGSDDQDDRPAMRMLLLKTFLVGAIILVAGYAVAKSGEALAQQTGLGSSFAGFVLVAIATSLPELSTALSAVRRGLFTMAISDILGTNLINVGLLFLVDLLDTGEPVLNRVGDFAIFGALLAVVLTGLFQAGLAERNNKSVLRMGYDSLLVLIVYVVGLALLYTLRSTGP